MPMGYKLRGRPLFVVDLSMHIPGKITASVVLLAIGIAVALYRSEKPALPAEPAPVSVRVIEVVPQDVPRTLLAIGTVAPLHNVVIRPQVDAILTRIAVKEGQDVKQGDLLATLDDRASRASLAQAQASLAQSEAQLKGARADLQRYHQLASDQSISRQTLEQQQALTEQLAAAVQGNMANVEAAQVQLSHARILSPVSGRVGLHNVDEGSFVQANDSPGLFSVTQLDPVAVTFSLPQQHLQALQALVRQESPARVQVLSSHGESGGEVLATGQLIQMDNQISSSTGTLRTKAQFDNPSHRLWPGQLVNIALETHLHRNALVVAPPVVQRGLDRPYVYRVQGDRVESVPVQVIFQNSELAVIEGVSAGDRLVSDGHSRLIPGARVQVYPLSPVLADTALEAQP